MKKGFFAVVALLSCFIVFSGCNKNAHNVTTINPYMTANIGAYNFTATAVQPSTLDTQLHDTTTMLIITGFSSDLQYPLDKVVLSVTKYRGLTGTFSIVQGQAGAYFFHNNIKDDALGGIVAITKVTSNCLIGYFSFNTGLGSLVANGSFNVGLP
jgi:hypothetical protein